MKKQIIKFLPLISMLFSSCTPYSLQNYIPGNKVIEEKVVTPLDTLVTVTSYSKEVNEEIKSSFDNKIWSLHEELDPYHEYDGINNVYTLNKSVGTSKEVKVSKRLFNIVKEGIELTKFTKGIFNICLGDVIDLYKDKFSSGTMSDPNIFNQEDVKDSQLIDVFQCVPSYENIDKYIILDEDNLTIRLDKLKINNAYATYSLSLGAFAKGYALDELGSTYFNSKNPGIISLGSSSLEFFNNYPGKESKYYKLSYTNPSLMDIKNGRLFSFDIEGGLRVSTSSDLEKHYCIIKDDNYLMRSHIIDGRTGKLNNYYRMVSVLSKDCPNYVLDALSTTIYNISDRNVILSTVKEFENKYNCSIEFILCRPYSFTDINTFSISLTNGINSYIKENTKTSEIKAIDIINK